LETIAPDLGSSGASADSCVRHGPVAENGTVDVLGLDVGAVEVGLGEEVVLPATGAVPAGSVAVVVTGAVVVGFAGVGFALVGWVVVGFAGVGFVDDEARRAPRS
jgi:hypothetical protein